jgi:hypothetical protein
MAGESVNENIYLATTFGYGGQKRFSQTATCHSLALGAMAKRHLSKKKTWDYLTFLKNHRQFKTTFLER